MTARHVREVTLCNMMSTLIYLLKKVPHPQTHTHTHTHTHSISEKLWRSQLEAAIQVNCNPSETDFELSDIVW